MKLNIDILNLKSAMNNAGHILFESDKKDYNLNIIGVRSAHPIVDVFNDIMIVAWRYKGVWIIKQYVITTLAGLHYLKTPLNKKGCSILKEGRYSTAWQVALHNGSYEALCQRKAVKVFRDNDKDSEFDFDVPTDYGLFGINIHRASAYNVLPKIGKNSAGCQVFQSPKDFNEFMTLVNKSKDIYGNAFTYTLLNEKNFRG